MIESVDIMPTFEKDVISFFIGGVKKHLFIFYFLNYKIIILINQVSLERRFQRQSWY